MKHLALVLAVAALGVFLVSCTQAAVPTAPAQKLAAAAADKRPSPAPAPSPAEKVPEAEGMNKVLGDLTPDQQKKINEMSEVRAKALHEFDQTNADKMDAARKALKDANASKDEAAIKKATDDLAALTGKRDALTDKYTAMQFLTPRQKIKWSEYRAMTVMQLGLKRAKVELTDEQKAKSRAIYAEIAKDIPDLEKGAVRHATYTTLRERVVKEVLTDAQREAVKPSAPATRPAPKTNMTPQSKPASK